MYSYQTNLNSQQTEWSIYSTKEEKKTFEISSCIDSIILDIIIFEFQTKRTIYAMNL